MIRILVTGLTAAVLCAFAGGCKPTEDPREGARVGKAAGQPARGESRPVVVYCGRGEPLTSAALAAFEARSGAKVEVKYGGTAELAAAILEEGARSPADIFIAQDVSTLDFLERKGALASLSPALLERVPEGLRSSRGAWIGLSGRARVLAYNTSRVSPEDLPADLEALTEPRWKGRLGWAPENASFQAFIAAMVELRGREKARTWLEAMKANAPRHYPKNTPLLIAIGRGEIDAGLANHYYLHRLKEEHGDELPLANHFFKSGDAASLVNLSGGAILASSKAGQRATDLLDFLVSVEGQRHFVEGNFEFPVALGAAPPAGLPSLESLNPPPVAPTRPPDLEHAIRLLRETGVLR